MFDLKDCLVIGLMIAIGVAGWEGGILAYLITLVFAFALLGATIKVD